VLDARSHWNIEANCKVQQQQIEDRQSFSVLSCSEWPEAEYAPSHVLCGGRFNRLCPRPTGESEQFSPQTMNSSRIDDLAAAAFSRRDEKRLLYHSHMYKGTAVSCFPRRGGAASILKRHTITMYSYSLPQLTLPSTASLMFQLLLLLASCPAHMLSFVWRSTS
jgi:hypothetical protein